MTPLLRRSSAIDRKLKRVRKELSGLDSTIQSLSGVVRKPTGQRTRFELPQKEGGEMIRRPLRRSVENAPAPAGASGRNSDEDIPSATGERRAVDHVKQTAKNLQDDRFLDYLASSFEKRRPLGQERRVQRNKAILMSVFVLLILFWVIWRFFVYF